MQYIINMAPIFTPNQKESTPYMLWLKKKRLFLSSTCQETLEDRQLIPQKIKGILSV